MPSFSALQPWLNFGGLTLDFIGLLILAIEWRIAIAAERLESEIEEREERLRPRPAPGGRQADHPHGDVFEDMRRRQKLRERMSRGTMAREERRGWFVLALLLIAFGFLAQMAGSIPWPLGL